MSQTRSPRSGSAERLEAGRDEPGWRDRLNQHPLAPYHLILGAAMLLLILGLVMVLSSSSVESYEIHDSAFTLFSRQAIFAVIGVVAGGLEVAANGEALGNRSYGILVFQPNANNGFNLTA